jgi:hypothetical protein
VESVIRDTEKICYEIQESVVLRRGFGIMDFGADVILTGDVSSFQAKGSRKNTEKLHSIKTMPNRILEKMVLTAS